MKAIRESRTLKPSVPALTPEQVSNLAQLRLSPGWEALLDLLERFCIECDTQLVNVAVGDDAQIIAMHRRSQVAWQMMEWVQRHTLAAAQLDAEVYGSQRPSRLTPEQDSISRITSPIHRDT